MTDDLERRLREVRAFLNGEAPLHGHWFGDSLPPIHRHPRAFWWRQYLACLTEAADEIARLRAENEALREALKPFAHAAFEADGYPDCEAFTLVLRPDDEDGLREQDDEPESLITAGQLRRARQALQEGSRHE